MSLEQARLFQARRSELSNQLNSAVGRRSELVRQLSNSELGDVARAGIEGRLKVLDERIIQLERDIAQNGRDLADIPAEYTEETQEMPSGELSNGQMTGIAIVFTLAVLMPIAIAIARAIVRRASRPPAQNPQLIESAARLERMEQSIDAIAVEVERISEGQRFVSQLVAPRAEPVKIEDRYEVPDSRS